MLDRDRLDVLLEHPEMLTTAEMKAFAAIREQLIGGAPLSARQRDYVRTKFEAVVAAQKKAPAEAKKGKKRGKGVEESSPESERESRENLEILLGPKVVTRPPMARRTWE